MAANANTLWDSFGITSDWIEIYNPGPSNLNLQGWYLTDDDNSLTEWAFPDVTILAQDYLVVFASGMDTNVGAELHTSFQLKSDGEYLALVASGGVTVVHEYSPEFPKQFADISYGMGPIDDPRFFTNATPGSANTVGAEEFVADTKYDPDRGYYTNAVTVTITTATTGATIYVTTDFTRPTTNSTVYTDPMTLTNTTCLRAMAFQDNLYPSDADTQTYIFIDDVLNQPNDPATFPSSWAGTPAEYGMNPTIVTDPLYADRMHDALLSIPSISIVTETEHLFDGTTGIYTHPLETGPAWERPISFEWMNPQDTKG
ncbi:MAG: chitobiase/beta-hexosaminidase C-terminal domain-containing protein, partial [Kiritimatiellae bacterium]|nr:chitobiase/beta-hexosaminidase C-terminal domain-containing protein [Kiritimatiellia bacterium]